MLGFQVASLVPWVLPTIILPEMPFALLGIYPTLVHPGKSCQLSFEEAETEMPLGRVISRTCHAPSSLKLTPLI